MTRFDVPRNDRRDTLDALRRATETTRRSYARQVSSGALDADEASRRIQLLERLAEMLHAPWDVFAEVARQLRTADVPVIRIGVRFPDGVEVSADIVERYEIGQSAAETIATLRTAYRMAREMKRRSDATNTGSSVHFESDR